MAVRKPLDTQTHHQWARTAHLLALEAIVGSPHLQPGQLVFHGGTSLKLSWNSPRFSEDLDFLLDRQVEEVGLLMKRAAARIAERFHAIDPLFTVEVADKSKDADRMGAYLLTVGHPGYYGVAKVKTEFWRVDRSYLKGYPSALKTPQMDGDLLAKVSTLVPAADLETAFCDKLTAFATRPFLKWRDMFDLWWIGTQTDTPLNATAIVDQFRHNLSAYKTKDGLPAGDVLRQFTAQDRDELIRQSDPDLKKWLPEPVWNQVQGDGVKQMVDYVYQVLDLVARGLEQSPPSTEMLPKNPVRRRAP